MIQFHNLPIEFKGKDGVLKEWLTIIGSNHGSEIGNLAYNFISNEEILSINWQYLKHDYYTDIITFGYSEGEKVEGEIYISEEQVRQQASEYKVSEQQELLRVICHGLLHLIGFNDVSQEEKSRMREEEEKSLILHAQIIGN